MVLIVGVRVMACAAAIPRVLESDRIIPIATLKNG
jgi:hypothetical protein